MGSVCGTNSRSATGGSSGSAPELSGAAAHAARKAVGRVETRMARIEARRATLHDQMADAHTDHERLLELSGEDQALTAEHTQLEERWLELSEALEA